MNTHRSRLVLLPAALLLLVTASTRSLRSAEVRGIWITRWDYKTEDDVRRAIRWSAALGLNRVFFQVRGRADAFYRSDLEPWGEEIGGTDPGFDPLKVAVDEAAKAGVSLDAWINVMPGWKGAQVPASREHVFYKHPEWFLVDRQGKRHMKNATDYTILNPCLPEVRAYLVEVVKDIVTRYAVDGVQLDYIRFIGRDPENHIDYPYDARSLQLFRKYADTSPSEKPAAWDKWRGLAVDTLVYRIAEAARNARPGCRVSVAAIQDYDRAKKSLFQDVVKWQENGWVDEVYPMTYHRDADAFRFHALSAMSKGTLRKVIPGIGVHLLESAGEMARQIELVRSLGAGGYCLFAFASFYPSPSHESRIDAASTTLRGAMREKLKELNGVTKAAAKGTASKGTVPSESTRTVSADVPSAKRRKKEK